MHIEISMNVLSTKVEILHQFENCYVHLVAYSTWYLAVAAHTKCGGK